MGKTTLEVSPFYGLHPLFSLHSPSKTSFMLPVNYRGTTTSHHGPDPAFRVENSKFQAGSTFSIQISNVGFLQTEQHTLFKGLTAFLWLVPACSFSNPSTSGAGPNFWACRAPTSPLIYNWGKSRTTNTAFVREGDTASSLRGQEWFVLHVLQDRTLKWDWYRRLAPFSGRNSKRIDQPKHTLRFWFLLGKPYPVKKT